MKSKTLKIFATLFISVLFLTSCDNDDTTATDEFSTESVQKSSEVDVISDNVSSIIEIVYVLEEGLVSQKRLDPFLPECLTKTIVINGNNRNVTLDFDDCDMPNGDHVDGVITISYVRDPQAHNVTITYAMSDFYFNYINIEGGGTILREIMNDNGNPQSTNNQDITVTWPNGYAVHRVGEMITEWIEGFGTFLWSDNVFLTTGNWTTEFPNGDVNTGLVTTALRKEMSCRFIVSGVITLAHNGAEGTLDFGDGTCDNEAVFTGPNGVAHTIILE